MKTNPIDTEKIPDDYHQVSLTSHVDMSNIPYRHSTAIHGVDKVHSQGYHSSFQQQQQQHPQQQQKQHLRQLQQQQKPRLRQQQQQRLADFVKIQYIFLIQQYE
ncbi:unnamed protein product [Rotaria sordida]|uniref:Uncharacterized protein n=1 Tax=Rotaria sordida TaxID=392033 RepID=A0A814MYI1_9BILA|nr:unnamed protein product [Rotaria sordida]